MEAVILTFECDRYSVRVCRFRFGDYTTYATVAKSCDFRGLDRLIDRSYHLCQCIKSAIDFVVITSN
jgi:hypothetical protein